jgi:hypothetical protein
MILCCGRPAAAATVTSTWTQGAGGAWNSDANWDSAFFPDNGNGGFATYDAIIDLLGPYTVNLSADITLEDFTLNSALATVLHTGNKTLEVTGIADLLAGTHQLNGGALKGGTWNQSGGTLLFSSSGSNKIDGATVTGTLDLSAAGSYVTFTNGGFFTGDAEVTGAGSDLYLETVTLGGSAQTINVGTAADWAVFGASGAGNTLTLASNATVNLYGSYLQSSGAASVINQGLINVHPANANRLSYIYPQTLFTNEGTVDVLSGARLKLGNATSWNWTNAAAGTIQATDAIVQVYGTWSNAGAINLINSEFQIGGVVTTANLGIGGFTIDATSTVKIIGTLDNTGDTMTFNAATGDWWLWGGEDHGRHGQPEHRGGQAAV